MSDKVMNKMLSTTFKDPLWNISKLYKASPAAGAFSEWL